MRGDFRLPNYFSSRILFALSVILVFRVPSNASLFVEGNGGGTSLAELVEHVRTYLDNEPDLQERLDHVVAATLGNALRPGLGSRFDEELARQSLNLFDAVDVPKITETLPSSISDVHFKSDLNQCSPLARGVLSKEGGIFAFLDSQPN